MRPHDPSSISQRLRGTRPHKKRLFEGHCFCLLDTGQVLNRASMREGVPHWNPRLSKKCNADESESSSLACQFRIRVYTDSCLLHVSTDMDSSPPRCGLFFCPRSAGGSEFLASDTSVAGNRPTQPERRITMNKDQVKGTAEKVKGKARRGRREDDLGDKAQEAKGQLQQGAGEARKQYGDVKEDVKKSQP